MAERVTGGHGGAGGELGHEEIPSRSYRTGTDLSSRRGLRNAAALGGREVGDDEVAGGALRTRRHGERRPRMRTRRPARRSPKPRSRGGRVVARPAITSSVSTISSGS